MKKSQFFILSFIVLISACMTPTQNINSTGSEQNILPPNTDNEPLQERHIEEVEESASPEEETQKLNSEPEVLGGTNSFVYNFERTNYEEALESDKLVVLYFYAKWCPTCRIEVPKMYAAFDELETENVVGFRVNYKDGDTDDFEEQLAKQYGITYQHTKVFVKNNEVALKSLESWSKNEYIEKINNNL